MSPEILLPKNALTDPERAAIRGDLQLLTETQVDALLPIDRSTRWLLRRRARDPLPAFKVGGRVLYLKRDIEAWIYRQREKPPVVHKRRGRPRKTPATATAPVAAEGAVRA